MCKFCDNLEWREYRVPIRNTGACDNLCEFVNGKIEIYGDDVFLDDSNLCNGCDGCKEENNTFEIRTYDNRIGFDFIKNYKTLHIDYSSEMIEINYCPMCGRKLVEG